MRAVSRVVLSLVVASALLVGLVGPVVASDDAGLSGPHGAAPQFAPSEDASTINVTQEFSLTPSTPGEVTVRVRFAVPSRVISMQTEVPADADVVETDGFRPGTGAEYEWDETTAEPSLTYTLPVNESLNDTSPEGADGDLVAVDAGEWALFQRPPTPTDWQNYAAEEPIELEQTATTGGPGATGEWLVFLGEHDTYERTASDQSFTLVVPSNATLAASPDAVLDSLADASDALRVGDRDEEVVVVAAPTDGVRWGVRGYQTGEADLWVRDAEPVATPDNAWVHEYVHSRQEFALAAEMEWFREASASYYAALLTFEQSRVRYDGFSDRLAAGENSTYDDAVLANQSTWRADPHYDRGALVAGQLDRRIRTAMDRERTLQTIFRAMNDESDPISLSEFLALLGEHGDERVVASGERYAGTTANATMWNQSAHVAAFGDLPARIGVQLPNDANDGTYRIDGSYRNVTVDGGEDLVLVTDERLRVDAVVDNAGGRTGNYTTSMAVNGTVVDRTSGAVAPNESTAAELSHRFATRGTYELALGGDNRTVTVREPATARVTDVTADDRTVVEGDPVDVSARVENDADVPGETTVVFRRDDGLFVTETAYLAPESAERVTVSVPTSSAGPTNVSVDDAGAVTVSVRPPPGQTATETATDSAGGSVPRTTSEPANRTASATPSDRTSSGGRGSGLRGLTVALALAVGVTLALLRKDR